MIGDAAFLIFLSIVWICSATGSNQQNSINSKINQVQPVQEREISSNDLELESDMFDEDKRAWKDMQSSGWGKRAWKDLPASGWGKRGWQNLQSSGWGKRGWQDLQGSGWGKRGWQDLQGSGWGKRGWQNLQGSGWGKRDWKNLQSSGWGKRSQNDLQGAWSKRYLRDLQSEEKPVLLADEIADEMIQHEVNKRGWENLKGLSRTGDGVAASNWGSMKGAWGKRDPAWHNLKGLWGKRSVGYDAVDEIPEAAENYFRLSDDRKLERLQPDMGYMEE